MKKLRYLLILLISTLAFNLSVYAAASGSLSVNKTSAYVDDSFKATVSISSAAAWNIHVRATGPVSSGCAINAADATADAQDTSKTFDVTCTATGEGTITLTLTGDVTSAVDGNAVNLSGTKTITVTARPLSSDSKLKSLSVSGYSISPSFNANTKAYNVTVPTSVSSVSISATANSSKATVTGTGTVSLSSNPTTATIKVTAEDGSSTNYTITITKEAPVLSSDSKLKSLSVSGYSISPSFNANTKAYNVTVPTSVSSVSISATANSSKATVTGTGTVSLSSNPTTATIKVTAEDGSSTNYTVTITKEDVALSSDSTLKALKISGYSLSPSFKAATKEYSVSGVTSTSVTVTATPNHSKAKAAVTGNKNLVIGKNTVTITVTAEDGSKSTYTVEVTRIESKTPVKSNNKDIALNISSSHTITPEFSNSVDEYEVVVPNEVEKLELTATPEDTKATAEVKGGENLLVDGQNVVTITVTAEDGTTRTIKLNVTRSKQENKARVLDIKIKDNDTLTPTFDPEVFKYNAKVGADIDKVDLIVTVPDGVTYTIEGNEDLVEGENTVSVTAKDANEFEVVYQIIVNKEAKKSCFGWLEILILAILLLIILVLLILLFTRKKKKADDVNNEAEAPVNNPPVNGATDTVEEYNIYDENVTKDELFDAINESMETKNTEKLMMLLEQEKLNRKKEELRERDRMNRQ